jgi:hypothetical protein
MTTPRAHRDAVSVIVPQYFISALHDMMTFKALDISLPAEETPITVFNQNGIAP